MDKEREKLALKNQDGSINALYQLGNCIGKGQFGSVYRGLDLTTGEIVAVKRVKIVNGELDQEEIMKEVSLLKALSHTNVIQYIGFIKTQNHMNIILEYAENGSLMSTLKAFGAFPEKLVASFSIKLLNGLEYLHANEVVHCDLKAANILTTKTGDVKLTDFGISLNLKIKCADAGAVSGTPNWSRLAPEVIELKGASTKSDIWSLGCTIVELATGKPPYANLISMSAMFRIVEDDYPPIPKNISEEMHSFLLCCFQKNPDHRPTATELKEHIWIRNNGQRTRDRAEGRAKLTQSVHYGQHLARQDLTFEVSKQSIHVSKNPKRETNTGSEELIEEKERHGKETIKNTNSAITNVYEADQGDGHDREGETHKFVQTSCEKSVKCKVCCELIKIKQLFCEVCSLVCHEACRDHAFSCPPNVNGQQPSYDVSTL
ncbi:kinase-like domain-containing protein [Phycomyces blakesleeanus]|uniref:Kinase-like domain-containing protein n=1 Tax=Phycomyces blakesleeanus TaxID=4837 RepID=A0ABR3AXM2_PHYBL